MTQVVIGLDQCFLSVESNSLVDFEINCVDHGKIFNIIRQIKNIRKPVILQVFLKYFSYIYVCIYVYYCNINCITHHISDDNYLKITGLHDIKKTQRFSNTIEQKRRNCYESEEKPFMLQLSPQCKFLIQPLLKKGSVGSLLTLLWYSYTYLNNAQRSSTSQILTRDSCKNIELHHYYFNRRLIST